MQEFRDDLNVRHTLIKIDLDSKQPAALLEIADRIDWIVPMLNLTFVSYHQYETKNGWHMVLEIAEPLQPIEIVLLQSLCGSDFKREVFNMARVLKLSDAPTFWQSRWNVLYTEKLPKEEEL